MAGQSRSSLVVHVRVHKELLLLDGGVASGLVKAWGDFFNSGSSGVFFIGYYIMESLWEWVLHRGGW